MDTRRASSKQIPILTAKMTPEMCRAIRRQETNSGLDYWRTGFSHSNITDNTHGMQDKKPTYRGITQVNFDFPGLFLPNVGTQSLRQKRKGAKGQSIVLNRTKSTLGPEMKIGRSTDLRSKTNNPNQSKESTVSDLTCLQLADTLLTYNKTPLSGVLGHSSFGLYSSPLASRYVDLFNNNKVSDNATNDDQHSKINKESHINSNGDKKFPILMYHTFQADDNDVIAERHRDVVSPTSDQQVVDIDITAKPQTKPQKSILKNGFSQKTNRPSSETAITYKYTTLDKPTASSYHLPGAAKSHLRTVSETRLPTTSIYPKIQNDMKEVGHHRGLRSIPVKHESTGAIRHIPIRLERDHTSFGEYRGLETRKRSVRFNAAHEVREYTPCEPTSFC